MSPDDTYTHGHADSVLRSHRWRTVANSAPHLVPHLRPGLDLLDVGCGPGTITADLAARVAPGRVVGMDRSPDVIAAAAASGFGSDGLTFVVGDVYALDAPDASFDVVHAHQVLQHLSDPVAALVEMRRVCRADGVLAVRESDYAAFTWDPPDPALDRWLAVYRAVARGNDADPDAGRRLKGWALAAGFGSVSVSCTVWTFSTPDERAWWGGLWADRVTGTTLADQAVAAGLATRDELAAMASAFHRWAADDTAAFIVPSVEILARP
ncbi:MAG TPA: methyltransferase domain-containing protein [Iamia sp.]|nr:methyltransferase domain-containing protein [Iamia sp.]